MSSKLFEPIELGSLKLANRILIAPMCQYSAVNGNATSWHTIHLGHLALSGAGLMILEATSVEPEGRITPGDLGLYCDENEQALAGTIKAIRENSAMPLSIQLAHAGRKASCEVPWRGGKQIAPTAPSGWQTVGASPVAMMPGDVAPTPLDKAGLERIKANFAAAAKRAAKLGFDAIEIHGAHGYLLHTFLSPLSNKREDAYGGSLANRMRFPLEVFDAVRAAFPADKPVGIRISATDWVEGGWDLEQSLEFSNALKQHGTAYVHVSSGGLAAEQKIPLSAGYQVPFAVEVKAQTGVPTIAVGLITEPKHAEEIVASGQADMISLARAMLYDPRWPWHAAAELGAQVVAPPQYLRSQPRHLKTLFSNG